MSGGRRLAQAYHAEVVRPILDAACPGLPHLAGLLGSGSEVLGYDDDRSADHDFGLRLTVLVDDNDQAALDVIDAALDDGLPLTFRGFPVRFATTGDARARHGVELATVGDFAADRLGARVDGGSPDTALGLADWLCVTGQSVLEVVGGPVFHDTTRSFGLLRQRLAWYPHDVWLYALSSAWHHVGQEQPFVGRTADRGDDLGSALIAARLAGHLVHLAFLLERTWRPYAKWTGTALRALPCGPALASVLAEAGTGAGDWRIRQAALAAGAELLARRQADLGLPTPPAATEAFFDRPYLGIVAEVERRLRAGITDPAVLALPPGVGTVEQWCTSVDLLTRPLRRRNLRAAYQAGFDQRRP